ncbi:exodeoxyribonuclease V subunit alpha [Ferrimonas aestuarii]|uniref:RecBCD enzyme subunit RecD n=1 Tax=Ferrimonas aestuarii TaxID=2569539 RepID=A0A4U1BRV1_9GAMM|nr:exodeoxyribonuclease V subunit alpha [Ferrimonas aestuarii]TKB57584.1 exodeoxyribonuclease V subunit alpha [Ferrimonas aestuarii]
MSQSISITDEGLKSVSHKAPLSEVLKAYETQGWLRPLDLAFAKFLQQHYPNTCGSVLLMAVWGSHQLGRGHLCLDLAMLLESPEQLLALPPEGRRHDDLPLPSQLMPASRPQWQLPTLLARLKASPLVEVEENDGVDAFNDPNSQRRNAPLVLSQGRLYLRRYFDYECQVSALIHQRLNTTVTPPQQQRQSLDALFASLKSDAERSGEQVHWQSVAAALASRSGFTVISGGPGTGKTTTVVRLLALLQNQAINSDGGGRLRIKLAAPTGKAAARLSESLAGARDQLPPELIDTIPTEVSTLHRLLGTRHNSRRFKHHSGNPLHLDLLVVDEASMVDLEMMAQLLSALPEHGRLILLGDKDQLASVEAGAVLGDLCQYADGGNYNPQTLAYVQQQTGIDLRDYAGEGTELDQQVVVLRHSHRFDANSGIGRLAKAVNDGNIAAVKQHLSQPSADLGTRVLIDEQDRNLERLCVVGDDNDVRSQKQGLPQGYGNYLSQMHQGLAKLAEQAQSIGDSATGWQSLLEQQDQLIHKLHTAFAQFQLLCAVREGEYGVQGLNRRVAEALRSQGLIEQTQGWYSGRPVIVTRNDYGLKLMNGDVGICLPVFDEQGERRLKVAFLTIDGGIKLVMPSRLSDVETVFAMTVHKSQGSEFAHTAMVLPPADNPVLTRELLYTGITRARHWFTLLMPRPSLVNTMIKRRTFRSSGLGQRLRKPQV